MDDKTQPILALYRGLQRQVEEHPYESLAVAAGIGFVLGGGLVSKLGVKLVASGLRVGLASVATPMLNSLLQEVVNLEQKAPRAHSAAQPPS